MTGGTFIPLSDAWFEPGDGCRLMIATTQHGLPLELAVRMADGNALAFRHVAYIKGRRVYEATWRCPESASDPAARDRLPQLSGPFREGPRDVV